MKFFPRVFYRFFTKGVEKVLKVVISFANGWCPKKVVSRVTLG
jgi:hypothetical protein